MTEPATRWQARPGKTYESYLTPSGWAIFPTWPDGARQRRPADRCEHCGRGDWEDIVYRSMEEAEAAGLVERVQ